MAPTPVFLPGESPWTEEPGGQQSMGSQRVRHDWSDLTHTHIPQSRVSFSVRWLSFLIAISWDLWLVKGLWKHWHTTQKLGFKSFIFGGGLASKLYPTLATVALPGSSVHGVFQARILEWIAISYHYIMSSFNLGRQWFLRDALTLAPVIVEWEWRYWYSFWILFSFFLFILIGG